MTHWIRPLVARAQTFGLVPRLSASVRLLSTTGEVRDDPGNEAKLKMYSLFEQASVGPDCSGVSSGKDEPHAGSSPRLIKISKAMKAYLENAKKNEEFMKQKIEEYELGKRHLANIMGWDVNRITQDDIDSAIRYLLPSGLFQPNARPMMRPPEEIYPKSKAAMFDYEGRPHHYLFYTGQPNYYGLLADIHAAFMQLNKFEDSMIANGILNAPPEAQVDLAGTEWIKYEDLQRRFMERLKQKDYDYLIQTFERLVNHPYSARVKDLFLKYRIELFAVTKAMEYPPLTYEEGSDRPYADAEGLRKHCVAKVRVYGNGSGKFEVNGKDLTYWRHIYMREQIMFPLQFTGMTFKVDVVAQVKGIGESSQAGAVRHGISQALRSFLPSEVVEEMRVAGLLQKDRRVKERKKYGQEGARRKFTWKKR